MTEPNITLSVDLTNPGQFFACCGLLELADRLWPGAEGWFDRGMFHVVAESPCDMSKLLAEVVACQITELDPANAGASPLQLGSPFNLWLDWWNDDVSGGSRFKTWAGRQTVFTIATAMHTNLVQATMEQSSLWGTARGGGLPFNFDSDLGGQGSALDIGFSFDPLSGSEATRIEGTCKPALEFLCFVGLQRFRPREIPRKNRFVFTAWNTPLSPSVASAVACDALMLGDSPRYEFKLLYRTKYLKSFLPAIPFQGDRDE